LRPKRRATTKTAIYKKNQEKTITKIVPSAAANLATRSKKKTVKTEKLMKNSHLGK